MPISGGSIGRLKVHMNEKMLPAWSNHQKRILSFPYITIRIDCCFMIIFLKII